MNCFVSTKFEQRDQAKAFMLKLEAAGHSVTHDWTTETADNLTRDEFVPTMQRFANDDIEGVRRAEVLILINQPNCRGAYVEDGIAIALGKPVIVIHAERGEHVFFYAPNHYLVKTEEDALAIVKGLSVSRGRV